jgi:hypothetical protein
LRTVPLDADVPINVAWRIAYGASTPGLLFSSTPTCAMISLVWPCVMFSGA